MNIKKLSLISAVVFSTAFTAGAQAQTTTSVVSDIFPVTDTGDLTASYFGTSGSSALDTDMLNNLGLRSGGSGRQLHGLFDTITLEQAGDSLTSSVTFITPATTAQEVDDNNLRIGLFDRLDEFGADGELLPNPRAANLSTTTSNPGVAVVGLPGIVVDFDVFSVGLTEGDIDDESLTPDVAVPRDITLRQSAPSITGRLLSSTGNNSIPTISSSEAIDPAIYQFTANTTYNITINIERVEPEANDGDDLSITIDFSTVDENGDFSAIGSHTDTVSATISSPAAAGATFVGGSIDTVPSAEPSYSFGMMGLGVSSNAFGSVNGNNAVDNGIDILAFTVDSTIGGDVIIPVEPEDEDEAFCVPVVGSNGTSVICL